MNSVDRILQRIDLEGAVVIPVRSWRLVGHVLFLLFGLTLWTVGVTAPIYALIAGEFLETGPIILTVFFIFSLLALPLTVSLGAKHSRRIWRIGGVEFSNEGMRLVARKADGPEWPMFRWSDVTEARTVMPFYQGIGWPRQARITLVPDARQVAAQAVIAGPIDLLDESRMLTAPRDPHGVQFVDYRLPWGLAGGPFRNARLIRRLATLTA